MIVETKEPGYEAIVYCDGEPLDPRPSQEVYNHSPDGFAWGYGGSGPAQLALAILLHAGLYPERAVRHHQAFKWQFVAPLPQHGVWAFEVDVDEWIEGKR